MEVAGSTGDAGRKRGKKTVEWLDDVRTCSVGFSPTSVFGVRFRCGVAWWGYSRGVMLPIQEQLWRLFGDRLQLSRGGGGPKA